MSRDRFGPVLSAAMGGAVAWLACRTTGALLSFVTTAPELPLWDEAKYGLDGARLAAALGSLDLPRFAALVYDLDVWPPFFPVTESLVFVVAGNAFTVARGFVAVLFLLLVLSTFWAAREIAPESPAVGVLAAALVVSSPFVQIFAVQAMLEVPGALLYALCVGCYERHLRTGTRATLVATGVASAALFFTKYNYGLLWLAALALNEAWLTYGGFRAMLDRVIAITRRIDWRRPFTVFVLLYMAALVAIAVTGGGTLPLGEKGVSVTSIGNPLMLLLGVVVARLAFRPRRSWGRFRAWERSLHRRFRVLFWTVAAPALVWLLLPPHLRNFVDFVENRSDGPSLLTAEGWLFYPRVFAEQFHANAALGWIVSVAAVAALARLGHAATRGRVILLGAAVAVAALTLHPYKEPRFLLIAAPVLWLAAAWNVVSLVEAALVRARWAHAPAPRLVNGALVLIALIVVLRAPATSPSLGDGFARHTVPASTAPLLDRVLDLGAQRRTLVLGTWNQASPALVEWRFLQRTDAKRAGDAPEVVVPSRGGAGQIARRLRGESAPEQIVFLGVDEGTAPSPEWAAAFSDEIAWLEPVRTELDAGTTPYGAAPVESFAGDGYRVHVYRLARSLTPPSSPAE